MFASLLKCRFTKFIPCKSTVENHVELSFDDTRHYTTHSILLLNKPVHTPTQYNTYPMRQAFLLSELSQCHTTHTTDNASSSQGPLRLVDPKPTPAPSAKLDLWLWGCTLRTWTSCSPRTHKTAHGLKPNRRMHRSFHFPLAIEVFEILKNYRVYLFISLLLAYSPVNRTGSPQGFSQVQISRTSWTQYKTCTLHKRKTHQHKPKGSPFGIALVKKKGK